MYTAEQKREYIAAEYSRIQADIDKLIDHVELLELNLNHSAVVYSVNRLITIKWGFDCLKNALNDTN